MVVKEQKDLSVLAHLLGLFTGFLGPLIMYLVIDKKDKFSKENAKNALNFQFTLVVAYLVLFFMFLMSFLIMFLFIFFLFFIIFAIIIIDIVFCIIGAVKASEGKAYKYPLAINFIP